MLRVTARRSFILHWDPLSILVFHAAVVLTLIHPCRGQSEVIGPRQPVVALIGDDVVLPCHLDPVMDAFLMTLEWARPDLDPRFVLVWRDGVDLGSKKHPLYSRRTSLFTDGLRSGNISLQISKVKQSDGGTYRCFVPELDRVTTVQLIVGAASSPVAQINRTSSRVVLQCEAAGWYPEPELLWLDGEGNLLPAGPTETLRGPDGLYTVSSRVTVEKRHSNNFTCRVQQQNISQSRETHIHVPDDFLMLISPSSPPGSPAGNPYIITGLAIGALVLILVLAVYFFLWKRRRAKCKKKTKYKKTMDSKCEEEGESEPLMKGREEETAVDIAGERTNTSPVPEKITEIKLKQETHEEEEEDLDSRGEQERMINPSLVIKKDKFTTEQETREAKTGRGVKAEGGEGEKKMEAGEEESGLRLSTCTEKPEVQQLLVREAAYFNFTDAQKKPQKNQTEQLEAEQQREENQRTLQSETRVENDKDETELKTPKNKHKQDHMEGERKDNIEAEKELDQDTKQPKFQTKFQTKPETKKVGTELKRQKDKNKLAPKDQDKIERKPRGNKEKGQKKNQKREKKLLPVSSDVPERTDLTVQEITLEENQEKEEEEEMRAQPESLRRAESKKGAQEEVTEINEGIHTEEICRKDEKKEKLQQGQEREQWTEQQLDMNEKPIKEQLEEPVRPSEGGVACEHEPHEPMEFEEIRHADRNSIKGRKFMQGVLHTDQQQTGRKKNYQEKHERQGRNFKRRKECLEEENDDLMEVEGEANNREDVPAGPQRKRGKFQPDEDPMETQ